MDNELTPAAREAMLEFAVNAAGGGHDMTGFEPVDDQDGRPNGFDYLYSGGSQCWILFLPR